MFTRTLPILLSLLVLSCGDDAVNSLIDRDSTVAFTAIVPNCSTAPADWLVSVDPLGGKGYNIHEVASGADSKSSDPLTDIWGVDQISGTRPRMVQPGQIIELEPGDYPHATFAMSYDLLSGHKKAKNASDVQFGLDAPITIRAQVPQTVHILESPVGGSENLTLNWVGAVTFEGLVLDGDDAAGIRTAIPFNANYHQGYRDIHFCRSVLRGGYDFTKPKTDPNNLAHKFKWGIQSYELGHSASIDPKAIGMGWFGGEISGIYEEHIIYAHSPLGNWYVGGFSSNDRLLIKYAGRTVFQMANRSFDDPANKCDHAEGPAGFGDLTFSHLDIIDVCLQPGGGGSALSFNGNHTGHILIDDVSCKLGADPALHADYNQNITGCFVSWVGCGTNNNPNGDITISNSLFQVGPYFVGRNSARRPNLQVAHAASFTLGPNVTIMQMKEIGSNKLPAQALTIASNSIGKIVLYKNNTVVGDVVFDSTTYKDKNFDGSGYRDMLDAVAGNAKVEIR